MNQIIQEMAVQKNDIREVSIKLNRAEVTCTRQKLNVDKLTNEIEQKDNFGDQIVSFY